MALTSIIRILKVNEARKGEKEGRAWAMQDAECMLMDDNGEVQQVGVLQLPRTLMGENAPVVGTYIGAFALQAGMRDRRIAAVLTALTPYNAPTRAAAPKPAA